MRRIASRRVTVADYVYNASNLRTTKTVGGVTTHYVYGMGGLLYGEYDSSGNLIREYVYLNGEPLAQIDDVSSSDVVTYLHTDHLGTPRYGTDSTGSQVWNWDSDAFGVGTPTGSVDVNLRFAGQYYDAESGLHYNWNRYYDPATGRYITSDPIGLAGGMNTYLYANANPVMFIDPRGLTLTCPSSPPYGNPDWVKARNDLHCGWDTYKENRKATPSNPSGECVYDDNGCLVDKYHYFPWCGGTPNSYPDDDIFGHGVLDPGGVLRNVLPAGSDTIWERILSTAGQDTSKTCSCTID